MRKNKILDDLLKEAQTDPELYNHIARILYKDFDIKSAQLNLIVLHIIKEIEKNE